ncbi:MAG TPA: DEAD/DEAH box helicase [Candidatus Norongarragalinales archaeon]|nr:DEAD/DEAH box helicase [Candidatus Norongarragalinales archaeon]
MVHLHPEVLKVAKAKGFADFTDIQKKAIPVIAEGNDVLVIAATGFGKTECAVLPILSKLVEMQEKEKLEGIQCIYITPLRALNRDMLERLTFWCKILGITLAVRHGDTKQSERQRQLVEPPVFLITTPETFQAVLVSPRFSLFLKNAKWVVVDEVHELADSKRGVQLSVGLARLREFSPSFQTIGLSATVGNAEETASFLSKNSVVLKDDIARKLHLSVEMPETPVGAEKLIEGIAGETVSKIERIKELVESHNKTLIFVNTRYTAESLANLLFKIPGFSDKIAVHHSSLSKESRIEVEQEFKNPKGKLKAIVCTSSLELGIDVGAIDLVIQYVSPRQVSRLIQRIGRSGHRAGLIPKGVLIASSPLDALESLAVSEKAIAREIEPLSIPRNSLDVLAHQIAGIVLDKKKTSVGEAYSICKRAFPYWNLDLNVFLGVVKLLAQLRIVAFDGVELQEMKRTRLYYYQNLSSIPDEKRFWIKDAASRKNVGVLDEAFVSEYLQEGRIFITRGKAWKVLSVGEKEIAVEQSGDITAAVPDWVGEEIPVPPEISGSVAGFFSSKILAEKDLAAKLDSFIEEQAKHFVPSANEIVLEKRENLVLVHCFKGNKINETIAKVIAPLLSKGFAVRTKANAYGILLEFPPRQNVELDKIALLLAQVGGEKVQQVLAAVLPQSSLFAVKFSHVGKRFGFIRRDAEYRSVSLKRIVKSLEADSPLLREVFNELYSEKLDVLGAANVFTDLAFGKMKIKTVESEGGWSPLAAEFLSFGGFSELFIPAEPTEKILAAFKAELLEKTLRLKCAFCGKTSFKKLELAGVVYCPYCRSQRLFPAEEGLKGERMKNEAQTIGTLVATFGMRALIALSTYGVGPGRAGGILGKMQKTDEEFFRDLLEAQKTFIRTKKYWRT